MDIKRIKNFVGEKVTYDKESQKIFGIKKKHQPGSLDDGMQMILDVRGWGAIQNMFKDGNGRIVINEAAKFQDELGQFITDAINEKLERTI